MRVESIWGEIVKVLAEVYAYIHEIERKPELTDNDIAGVLSFFCNKVKELFDKKTGSDCCVSIKVPISHYSDSGEWQLGNTAYSYVISMIIKESSKPRVYLDNNVQSNANYLTTSGRTEVPYKSELVVPIIPSRYRQLSEVYFGGFLCVDSDKKDSFDPKHYDVPMIVGLADGLYVIMQRLIELQNDEPK